MCQSNQWSNHILCWTWRWQLNRKAHIIFKQSNSNENGKWNGPTSIISHSLKTMTQKNLYFGASDKAHNRWHEWVCHHWMWRLTSLSTSTSHGTVFENSGDRIQNANAGVLSGLSPVGCTSNKQLVLDTLTAVLKLFDDLYFNGTPNDPLNRFPNDPIKGLPIDSNFEDESISIQRLSWKQFNWMIFS